MRFKNRVNIHLFTSLVHMVNIKYYFVGEVHAGNITNEEEA